MIDRGVHNLLGVAINAVDYEYVVDRILSAAKQGEPCSTTALAVHGVMTGVADREHRHRINHLDLVVPDGQPVKWALNLLHGTRLKDRVYGPTLTLKVCEQAASDGVPVFLYGSQADVLDKMSRNLMNRFPGLQIAGCLPSLFRATSLTEKRQIVEQVKNSGARLLILGLGCPRQEVWAYEYREALTMPILAVGAAFDFHAGSLKQAPGLMQSAGLEWLFRLACEPQRLWRRYLLLNPWYVWSVFLQYSGIKKFDLRQTTPPVRSCDYG